MIRNFSGILRAAGFAVAVAVSLLGHRSAPGSPRAPRLHPDASPPQSTECLAITACMRKTSSLSQPARPVPKISKFAKSIKGLLMLQCRKLSTFVRHRKHKVH